MSRKDFYEDAQIIDYVSKEDGLGGVRWEQIPGAKIKAGFFVNNSTEAVLAGRLGNKAIFTVQTDANVELEQNDVIQRKSDGRMYRITSNAFDMTTPAVATDHYRECTAEVLT